MNQELFTAVDTYIDQLFNPPDEALAATLQSAREAGMPERHAITPNQGKFLHMLALMRGAHIILEIGTLAGYSAIWMARAILPDGHLITLDHDEHHIEVARANIACAGLSDIIQVRAGHALETMAALQQEMAGPFDMVFVDADKLPYVDYLEAALRLTTSGSVLVFDNAVRHGDILDPDQHDDNLKAICRFNERLAADPRVTATITPTVGSKGYDGMALAVVK